MEVGCFLIYYKQNTLPWLSTNFLSILSKRQAANKVSIEKSPPHINYIK